MNHSKHYDLLISKAKNRKLDPSVYVENHHIVPVCMGGNDDPVNMILLTAEEHFLAHLLLWKMFPSDGHLALAIHRMIKESKYTGGRNGFNKRYGYWRRSLQKVLKELRWWNNGKVNRRSKDQPGPEWKLGMVNPPWNKGIKQGYCWTNGISFRVQFEQPGPEWVKGSSTKGKSFKNKAEEARLKSGHQGTQWWNNGTKRRRSDICPGPDWKPGAAIRSSGSKGMKWWNNGQKSVLQLASPGEGWIPGRLQKYNT